MGVQHEGKGRMLLRGGFVVVGLGVEAGERECVRVNINTHYSLPGGVVWDGRHSSASVQGSTHGVSAKKVL